MTLGDSLLQYTALKPYWNPSLPMARIAHQAFFFLVHEFSYYVQSAQPSPVRLFIRLFVVCVVCLCLLL